MLHGLLSFLFELNTLQKLLYRSCRCCPCAAAASTVTDYNSNNITYFTHEVGKNFVKLTTVKKFKMSSKPTDLVEKKKPPEKSGGPRPPTGSTMASPGNRRFYLKLRSPTVDFQPPMGNADNMMTNGMPSVPTPQVMVPNYSVYTGSPSYVANMKVRSNVPSFLAENELKLDILKRQHISHAQV